MANVIAIPVTMASFQKLGAHLSPDVTLCVRGRHAVGKSEGVYQIAKKIFHDFYKTDEWARIKADPNNNLPFELKNHSYEDGLPVIERRLSQMSEGDIVGLPFMHENSRTGGKSTSFEPCDWLMLAIEFPVLLFLDERNRALEGVKQAVFQLTDSKAFYGKKLHNDTRIIVAENTGDAYEVQQCDPAEVSRCVTVQLEPTIDEFLDFAKTRAHDATIEFIREGGVKVLEHTEQFEANKKYQDRRAWMKLDKECQALDFFENPGDPLFHPLACSFIGVEIGSKFVSFVRNRDKNVSAKDILTNWEKAAKKLRGTSTEVSNQTYIACVGKLADYFEKLPGVITDDQAYNLAMFMWDCPSEPRLNLFSKMTKRSDVLLKAHKLIRPLMVATGAGGDASAVPRPAPPAKAAKASADVGEVTPTPRQRGGRR